MRRRGRRVAGDDLKVSATDAILDEECAFAGRGWSHMQLGIDLQTRIKKRRRTVWVVENKEGENHRSSYTSGRAERAWAEWADGKLQHPKMNGRRKWNIGVCSLTRKMSPWYVSWSQQEQQSQMGWKTIFRMVTTWSVLTAWSQDWKRRRRISWTISNLVRMFALPCPCVDRSMFSSCFLQEAKYPGYTKAFTPL